jgi:hypothetical protein
LLAGRLEHVFPSGGKGGTAGEGPRVPRPRRRYQRLERRKYKDNNFNYGVSRRPTLEMKSTDKGSRLERCSALSFAAGG